MPTIYVSRNGNSNQLKLRDNQGHNPGNEDLTTEVDPGDTVIWELDENSGLHSLEGVRAKEENDPERTNLFAGAPKRNSDGRIEARIVDQSPGKGKYQSYDIGFKITTDGETMWIDPKLQMNK